MIQPPHGDKAVDMGEGGGPVEEGQVVVARSLLHEKKQLAEAQGEQPPLFVHLQHGGFKQQLADDQQGLLMHLLPVMGQSLKQQAEQLLPAGLVDRLRFGEAFPVGGVVLKEHSNGVQRAGNGGVAGGAEQPLEPQHLLVELIGVQV